jgi:hypothetical protein
MAVVVTDQLFCCWYVVVAWFCREVQCRCEGYRYAIYASVYSFKMMEFADQQPLHVMLCNLVH